ncbi:MAG: radical SAM family heme chaperone HemW [Spirochaetota bacterium]
MISEKQLQPVVKKRNGYAGLYIHFPYCIHKCSYCDFYSLGVGKSYPIDEEAWYRAYTVELQQRLIENPQSREWVFDSIFLGGGTPSYATPKFWQKVLGFVLQRLPVSQDAEISIEMNPENVNLADLYALREIGCNRINVGIQSFRDTHLQFLDRYHQEAQYEQVLPSLEEVFPDSYGIDLIYGMPGQTVYDFQEELLHATSYSHLSHLSLYSLTVENGTKYKHLLDQKQKSPPEEELQVDILSKNPQWMRDAGFVQYEVSNYAKPGKHCRHNLKYWMLEPYLGIGPGAHGYTPRGRYQNIRSAQGYLQGKFSSEYQVADDWDELALSLFRIFLPIELGGFLQEKPREWETLYNLLQSYKERGLCDLQDGVFQWKPHAVLFLDSLVLEIATIVEEVGSL